MIDVDDADDRPLSFLDEAEAPPQPPWQILIVDDEPAVHEVTTMVLGGLRFGERSLRFDSAYSGAEARSKLDAQEDYAVVLLDVVMESDDAGLQLVRHIREQRHNERIRIILRTGQAGQAPERKVVLDYDINDYKDKTELTAQKLSTAVVTALRGYQTLSELDALNRDLEAKVAARTAELEQANQRLRESLHAIEQGERAGRRVQFKLLPPRNWRHAGCRFGHVLMPSEFMSGDFVDYFALDADRAAFYIADVSGHGVASAFVTVYVKRFMATALEARRQGQASAIDDPALLLQQLNRELLREKVGKHIAICYGILDRDGLRLLWANAGATPFPILADEDGSRYLDAPSTPAGMFEASQYQNRTLDLPDRYRLLLCSDGVLEVLPGSNSEARSEHLREALDSNCAGLDALCATLSIDPEATHPDDLTMLLIGRDGEAA